MRPYTFLFILLNLLLQCQHGTAQDAHSADSLIIFTHVTASTGIDCDLPKQTVHHSELVQINPITAIPFKSANAWLPSSEFHPPSHDVLSLTHSMHSFQKPIELGLKNDNKEFFLSNRRNRYSSLWGFASLNYIYADLVGLMDKNILAQYQQGEVNGAKITPGFLAAAAGFMQIPLSNVFLPQIIKNERTLRWIQIASGSIMTLVQAGTLFVGKPSPNYIVFSAFEIGTTLYITLDAIKWKPKRKNALSEE